MFKILKLNLILLFSFTCILVLEAKNDSLVFISEITFNSDFEKQAFHNYFSCDSSNYFELYMSINQDMNKENYSKYLSRFENHLKEINTDYFQRKKESKKIKTIYNIIHDSYLDKYDEQSFFPDIFKKGNYNCVSGSILYGLALKELQIPFDVKETPNHIYLVAYPNTSSILIETTNPIKGLFVFDFYFKGNFVDYLRDNKLISSEEYNNRSVNELFEEYFFREENITIKELAGIQYSNDAIFKMARQKYEDAFYQLEKSYLFYPSEKTAFLLLYTAANVIERNDYSELKYADFIYKLSRYEKYGITKNDILGEFGRITQTHLLYNGNTVLYDNFYNKIIENIENKDTKDEIAFVYNYERGRILNNQFKYGDAIDFLEKAYDLKPGNSDAQNLFVNSLIKVYSRENEAEDILEILNNYSDKHPELMQNVQFAQLKLTIYLFLIDNSFIMKNAVLGEKYIDIFKELYPEKNDNYFNIDAYIVRAFSSAATYYFRRNMYTSSRNILLKGLEYVPGNYELKNRLRALE